MKTRIQIIGRIVVSGAVSFSVLALIFSLISGDSGELSRTRILYAIWSVPLAAAGLYFVCQLLQAFLRAARYRVLLKGGGEKEVPAMPHLFLVSMTRNMFIDLLPARIGELSYVAMLNRGYRVSGEACVSSLGVSVLFDFLALWAVIVGVVLTPLMGKAGRGSLLGAGVLLTVLVAVGWAVLFRGVPAFSRRLGRMFGGAAEGSLTHRLVIFLDHVARSFKQVRESGVLLTTLALSAAVRVSKYLGLYILFVGVTRASWPAMASAPIWAVLAALIAAEGSASLPVPAFMSFGTYEAGGLVALTALGFSPEDSATAMMAMHIFSQAIDYTLGGLALVAFTLVAGRSSAAVSAGRAASARHSLAALAVAVLLSGSFLFFALQLRQLGKMGALAPPASGSPAAHGGDEDQKLRKAVQNLRGFIVWSSNRYGNHDILRLSLPDLKLTRLTKHPNLEYYPRISPDGTRVVFSRCQLAWGSLRDPVPWDVYLLDLRTGRESLVARGGNTPVWSEDGTRVYFQRARGKFVEHELASGRERVLFESGVGKVPPDVQLQTPDFNSALGRMAVTLRGKTRATAIFGLDGYYQRGPGGCEFFWSPDRSYLYYANRGRGGPGDGICRYDPRTGSSQMWVSLKPAFKYEYFPRVSNDGRYLIFGASTGGHEHDTSDYEVFLWKIGDPSTNVVRATFHTGNDMWPDLWLEPAL